jgi:phytoene dehydrogenase-like protein
MTQKSIIIIGAGISGLAAGCYGQMNGYKTWIFELHSAPGGLCTAWKRKGYTFDGCIHWLVGNPPAGRRAPRLGRTGSGAGAADR